MDYLKNYVEDHKHLNAELIEANRKFLFQIVHELLHDEEFAKKTLSVIQQNLIPYKEIRILIGSMKDYYKTTGRIPTYETVKMQIAERYSDEIDLKIANDLVDHCYTMELNGNRKDEVHFHWNTIYCMFQYIALLNEFYSLCRDSDNIFLSQYRLVKQLSDAIERWRKQFISDEAVKEVIGGNIVSDSDDNWDDVFQTAQIDPLNGSN